MVALIRDHAAHLIYVGLRLSFVMPGLDPGIHRSSQNAFFPDGLPGQARQ
jgi:hypothetical protein